MNLYKHKQNNKFYTIAHLVKDMRFLNRNAFSGIYAYPYKHNSEIISYILQDKRDGKIDIFNPEKFVEDNFEIVAELHHF